VREGDCKHYAGLYRAEACDAGVNLRELAGPGDGLALRLPCLKDFRDRAEAKGLPAASCPSYREPTDAEIEADRAEEEALFAESDRKMRLVMPVVAGCRKAHRGEVVDRDCPVCGAEGALRVGIASYNGHARVACKNGCVSFME